MTTVAEHIITSLADAGVTQVWGVVGDALNPLTDAIRTEERIEWVGVRHEEVAAFAVSAQAQLTGTLGVCMGTVGPGSIHLLNGLYDAKKSHAPVLAICGQVPSPEIGTDFFQEVDNNALFADVSVWSQTLTSAGQLPYLLEQAVNAAQSLRGVAVLTLPGDVGDLALDKGVRPATFAPIGVPAPAPDAQVDAAVAALAGDAPVTLLVGCGAREARSQVLELADVLAAPMVLTLKAKEGLEHDNPFEVGQSGLIGNPAAAKAMDDCDVLVLVGTDFPYRDWYPTGKTVIQLDARGEHVGRRTPVQHALVGDAAATLERLVPRLDRRTDRAHLETARTAYRGGTSGNARCSTRATTRRCSGGPAPSSTTPTSGSGRRPWRQPWTGSHRTRRSSPATPACRPRGSPASSLCAAPAGSSAPTTSARWPTRCRWRSARRPSTARVPSSPSPATAD